MKEVGAEQRCHGADAHPLIFGCQSGLRGHRCGPKIRARIYLDENFI